MGSSIIRNMILLLLAGCAAKPVSVKSQESLSSKVEKPSKTNDVLVGTQPTTLAPMATEVAEVAEVAEVKKLESKLVVSNSTFVEFANETREVHKVRFSRSGKYVLGAGYKKIRVWDLETKKRKATMSGHSGTITSADFSPDDKYVVSGGYDGSVRLWKTSNGKLVKKLGKHSNYVETVQFSNNGEYILTAGMDNVAKLWDVKKKKLLKSFKGHKDWILTAQFDSADQYILTGSQDRTIILWNINDGRAVKTFGQYTGTSAEGSNDNFTANDNTIYATSKNGIVYWTIEDGEQKPLFGDKEEFFAITLSKDNRFIVAAKKTEIQVYDLISKQLVKKIETSQSGGVCTWINSLSISYDSTLIAAGGCNDKISIWKISQVE